MSVTKDPYDFLGEDIKGAMEVKVWSMGAGLVSYSLSDPQVNRTWRPNELKVLTFHELYQLSNHPGGMPLLRDRLQIRDNKVREALQLSLDPEFLYTEEDAKNLVINGTENEVLDALEFGPLGLDSMIKHHAVLHIDSLDKVNFFNTLFGMNIQDLRTSLDRAEDEAPVQKRRADTSTSPIKKERKSKPLKPSEQLVQVPTE